MQRNHTYYDPTPLTQTPESTGNPGPGLTDQRGTNPVWESELTAVGSFTPIGRHAVIATATFDLIVRS